MRKKKKKAMNCCYKTASFSSFFWQLLNYKIISIAFKKLYIDEDEEEENDEEWDRPSIINENFNNLQRIKSKSINALKFTQKDVLSHMKKNFSNTKTKRVTYYAKPKNLNENQGEVCF